MKTRVGIISQARMTSSRLPGKVLMKAAGRSMLDYHLDRLEAVGYPVHIATTANVSDDPIVNLCEARGVPVYRGDEHDVLLRYVECATLFELDTVVRVTSDCPLIDGNEVLKGIEKFQSLDDEALYLSNCVERTYPDGFDYEIFSMALLQRAHLEATVQSEREHVTSFFYNHAEEKGISLHNMRYTARMGHLRVTLDTEDDLKLIAMLIEKHKAAQLNVDAITELLLTYQPERTSLLDDSR